MLHGCCPLACCRPRCIPVVIRCELQGVQRDQILQQGSRRLDQEVKSCRNVVRA